MSNPRDEQSPAAILDARGRALHEERHGLESARRMDKPFDADRLAAIHEEIDRLESAERGPAMDIKAEVETRALQLAVEHVALGLGTAFWRGIVGPAVEREAALRAERDGFKEAAAANALQHGRLTGEARTAWIAMESAMGTLWNARHLPEVLPAAVADVLEAWLSCVEHKVIPPCDVAELLAEIESAKRVTEDTMVAVARRASVAVILEDIEAAMRGVPIADLGAASWGAGTCMTWPGIVEEHEESDEDERRESTYTIVCESAGRVRDLLIAKAFLSTDGEEPRRDTDPAPASDSLADLGLTDADCTPETCAFLEAMRSSTPEEAQTAFETYLRATAKPDGGPRVCVVALVTDSADRLLLVRNRNRGGWELPGGKMKAGETWRDAVRREAREETGLGAVLADGDPQVLDGVPVGGAGYHSVILVARGHAEGTPVPGDDAEDARWFPVSELPWGELSPIASVKAVQAWEYERTGCDGCRGPLGENAQTVGDAGMVELCGACYVKAAAEAAAADERIAKQARPEERLDDVPPVLGEHGFVGPDRLRSLREGHDIDDEDSERQ